jgi:hypothetical protein
MVVPETFGGLAVVLDNNHLTFSSALAPECIGVHATCVASIATGALGILESAMRANELEIFLSTMLWVVLLVDSGTNLIIRQRLKEERRNEILRVEGSDGCVPLRCPRAVSPMPS